MSRTSVLRRVGMIGVLLLASAGGAGAQQSVTLVEDGDFTTWTTLSFGALTDPQQVSGVRQDSGGNPGAHYVVRHEHNSTTNQPTSRSLFTGGDFDLSTAGAGAALEFRLDHRVEAAAIPSLDDGVVGTRVRWTPIVVQGGKTFVATEYAQTRPWPTTFRSDTLVVPLDGPFRSGSPDLSPPDLSPGAPPVELGFLLWTVALVPLDSVRVVDVHVDNFRVRIVGPAEGPDLEVTATSSRTTVRDGLIIDFNVQVRNAGTTQLTGIEIEGFWGFHFRPEVPGCDFANVNAGWTARPSGNLLRPIGSLAPGELVVVAVCGKADFYGRLNPGSLVWSVHGAWDDPSSEADRANNSATVVVPRDRSCAPSECCSVTTLFCFFFGGEGCSENLTSASGERQRLLAGIGLGVRRFLDAAADVVTLYRVRERLQTTPGGRRVVELYYRHDPEVRQLLIDNQSLRQLALDGLDAWGDSLRRFADGEGVDVPVTGAQIDALQDFLDAVRPLASEALRAELEQAEADLDLRALEGLDVEQAFVGLDALVSPRPDGPALTSPEVPGFAFHVQITAQEGSVLPGVAEAACIPETLCVSGAVAGRAEVFVRVVGPKPNGFLWPTLVKFSTSTVEVWAEQLATGLVRYYRLEGAAPGRDELPGLFDRLGFPPLPTPLPATSAAAPGGHLPPRPAGDGFVSADFPDFRFDVRLLDQSGEAQAVRQEAGCIVETLCVSGAVPGRSEVFLRVVGPKPNGRLWPTLVRFTTSTVEVWIEQLSTGEQRYYRLEGATPGSDDLTGLFDREGFLP